MCTRTLPPKKKKIKNLSVYILVSAIHIDHHQFQGRATLGFQVVKPNDSDKDHGTHVAGFVGSKDFGVAKSVYLVSVEIFDDTSDKITTTSNHFPKASNGVLVK